MQSFVSEIEEVLARFPKRTSSQNPESYIGGGISGLRYIGLRVPHLRQAMQAGFSFSNKPQSELAAIWDEVWWSSDCFEVMSLALDWFYHPRQRPILESQWPRLKKWSSRVDNWAHSDSLSGIYARIHEVSPTSAYPIFEKWNRSRSPWLRRLSIVSLFYYSSQRAVQPRLEKVLRLVEPQLEFDHYFVQKGVGWTLREAGNAYPERTKAFITKNIHSISSIAFAAATEKMKNADRERLKRLRKDFRSSRPLD